MLYGRTMWRTILNGPKPASSLFTKEFPEHRSTLGTWRVLLLLCLALTACDPTRSYERSGNGTTVYLDQLSDTEKTEARRKIVERIREGTPVYDVGIGDEIEVFFQVNRTEVPGKYSLAVDDQIRIEFLNDPDIARTVKIAPDGQISLPLIGSTVAAGKTIDTLARHLEQRYKGVLADPKITVNVIEAHSRRQDFLDSIALSTKGQGLINKVLPDGTIAMPQLSPVMARGRTLPAIQNEVDSKYLALGLGVSVSLVPRTLRAGTTFVLGEVAKPGRIEMERPQTVLMAVAQAGGVLTTGSFTSVRLFYFGQDGVAHVRSINLKEVLEDLKIEQDMIVPNNSIIYVPTTELAKAGRMMDAVVRDILRFNGFAFGLNYVWNTNLNSGASTSTGVVTSPSR